MTRKSHYLFFFAFLAVGLLFLSGCSSLGTSPPTTKSIKQVDATSQKPPKSLPSRKRKASAQTTSSAKLYSLWQLRMDALFEEWRDTPYQLGGIDKNGIDCSAWTQLVYQQVFDKTLPRSTNQQAQIGRPTLRQNIQFGDLIFFITARNTRHVGVCLYDGFFVHASTKIGVTASSLKNPYWSQRFWQARRIMSQ